MKGVGLGRATGIWILLPLLLIILLCACAREAVPDYVSPSVYTDIAEDSSVTLSIDPDFERLGQHYAFKYVVTNSGKSVLHFGEDHRIEVWLNGEWYTTPLSDWNAYECQLSPGESLTQTAYLRGSIDAPPSEDSPKYSVAGRTRSIEWRSGRYRLIKVDRGARLRAGVSADSVASNARNGRVAKCFCFATRPFCLC